MPCSARTYAHSSLRVGHRPTLTCTAARYAPQPAAAAAAAAAAAQVVVVVAVAVVVASLWMAVRRGSYEAGGTSCQVGQVCVP
jgi:hypothetical protein